MIESESDKEIDKSKIQKVLDGFKSLIKKLKETIENCIKKVIEKFTGKQSSSTGFVSLNNVLEKLENQLKEAKEYGLKKIKFVDVEKGIKVISDFNNEMNKKIEKYFKKYIAFGRPQDGEKFLKEYNVVFEKVHKEYQKIMTTNIEMDISSAISLANRLKDSNDQLVKKMKSTKDTLEVLEQEYEGIAKGINDMTQYHGYIQNASTNSQIIRNHIKYMQRHWMEHYAYINSICAIALSSIGKYKPQVIGDIVAPAAIVAHKTNKRREEIENLRKQAKSYKNDNYEGVDALKYK